MIDSFRGKHFFLSNFSPSEVWYDGIRYPTVEHAFQASKTLDFAKRREIAQLVTPGEAKRAGRKVDLRPDWERVKLNIMWVLCLLKFMQPSFRRQLIMTGDQPLIEGNTWGDTYWGVCQGKGENHLGRILMELRGLLA